MAAIQHVFKRGSVYWWRRRLRIGTERCDWIKLELSLTTKELELARRIAPEVTLVSHRLHPGLKNKMISADDARRILIQVAREKSEYLDAIKSGSSGDAESNRRSETASGWAYRLLAAQGREAIVGPIEERELGMAGLDGELIEQVKAALDFYKKNNFARLGRRFLEELLKQHNIPPSDGDLRYAEALYLRGHAAALLNTERRWSGAREDDLALVQSALATALPIEQQSRSTFTQETRSPFPSDSWRSPAKDLAPPVMLPTNTSDAGFGDEEGRIEVDGQPLVEFEGTVVVVDQKAMPKVRSGPGLVEIVAQAAAEKIATGDWRPGLDRQHVGIAKLFVRFIGHDQPERMQQADIARFRSLLFQLPKNHGKSPNDHVLPVAELVARAKSLPSEKVGLSPTTLNRYMTQMGNIVDICKHAGYPFGNFEGVSGLRTRKRGDVRDERGRFRTEELKTLLALPVWNGSASLGDRLVEGDHIFHDATYWVPLLSMYNGGRREENCGLLIDEIENGDELPCFRFENNRLRALKTPQSKRRVPIHPELIRLGFLDYVEALRDAGHELLFPELRAANGVTPMGDVFDDSWQKMRAVALPTAKEDGKVFHSLRHWCNNEMKQRGIRSEIRKDIIGHVNGDMNEGRYTDPAQLQVMAEAMAVLPTPSAELAVHPIRLIEQVVTHRGRPSRARRQAV
ncbi:MAG: site-specific integrase [Rhizobium sp.]